MKDNHAETPEAFIEALHESVLTHAGGTGQADDLTAVVIRKT